MRGQDQPPVIVWFRQDLRVADHAALTAAIATHAPILPLYILDDEAPGAWALGGASRWWLHHSLHSLQAELAKRGATLILRRGPAAEILPALVHETGATAIHAGRMHEPWARQLDATIEAALPGQLRLHRTSTLFDLDSIKTKTGGIYGIYTPFAKAVRQRSAPAPATPAPRHITPGPGIASDTLADLQLLPTRPDWAAGFRETWAPGEAAAHDRLAAFVAKTVHGYNVGRNLPGQPGTSMLSAHLHWGEISPGQVWTAVAKAAGVPAADGAPAGSANAEHANAEHASAEHASAEHAGIDTYLSEILWREFSAYLLWHNTTMPEQPLRPRFAALPTRKSKPELHAWQHGRTGIPIVDAGMRQLWHLGWMHNRVRMIAASFLVKHLLMPWQAGEAWFWDTLVDADLASNAGSWQWIAGCGIDSQPFFRVFNPISQGEKFDPDGAYVRRWVPELTALPNKHLHAPFNAPADILSAAGVTLGKTYPRPIVDLQAGRQRALEAYRTTVREAADREATPEVNGREAAA